MLSILSYVALFSLLLALYSFIKMKEYLFKLGIIKRRLVPGVRPDVIMLEYCKVTKEKSHRIGIWFWVTLMGTMMCFITVIAQGILMITAK